MRTRTLSITLLGLLAAPLLSAPAMAGGITVVGSQTRQTAVKPGDRAEGRILLRNNGQEAADVRVYPTDYLFYSDGRNLYGEPAGKTPRSNAAWITFTPRQLTIPAGETASVDYTTQVPADSSLTGSYWSLLMVEPLAAGALEPPKAKEGQVAVGLRTVIRYAIDIITDIGDTGKRDLKFASKQLLVQDKQRVLQLDVENTGERGLVPMVWVEVFDAKGSSLGRFEGGRLRISPACSGRFRVDLSQLPKGAYSALVVADNGDDNAFGTRLKLEIP